MGLRARAEVTHLRLIVIAATDFIVTYSVVL